MTTWQWHPAAMGTETTSQIKIRLIILLAGILSITWTNLRRLQGRPQEQTTQGKITRYRSYWGSWRRSGQTWYGYWRGLDRKSISTVTYVLSIVTCLIMFCWSQTHKSSDATRHTVHVASGFFDVCWKVEEIASDGSIIFQPQKICLYLYLYI